MFSIGLEPISLHYVKVMCYQLHHKNFFVFPTGLEPIIPSRFSRCKREVLPITLREHYLTIYQSTRRSMISQPSPWQGDDLPVDLLVHKLLIIRAIGGIQTHVVLSLSDLEGRRHRSLGDYRIFESQITFFRITNYKFVPFWSCCM